MHCRCCLLVLYCTFLANIIANILLHPLRTCWIRNYCSINSLIRFLLQQCSLDLRERSSCGCCSDMLLSRSIRSIRIVTNISIIIVRKIFAILWYTSCLLLRRRHQSRILFLLLWLLIRWMLYKPHRRCFPTSYWATSIPYRILASNSILTTILATANIIITLRLLVSKLITLLIIGHIAFVILHGYFFAIAIIDTTLVT